MNQSSVLAKNLKITIFSYVFWPENFVVNDLVEKLTQNGHDVEVSTSLPNYETGKMHSRYSAFRGPYTEQWKGAVVKRFPVFNRGKGFLSLGLNYLTNIVFGFFNLFRLRNSDVVLVYATSPLIAFLPAIFFKIFIRKPVVIWYQDLWPESFFAVVKSSKINWLKPMLENVVRFIYSQTDVMLMQNQLFSENLDRLGFKKRRLTVYNWSLVAEGITKEVASADNVPGWVQELPSDKFIFTFAGNIGKVQGLAEILKAASTVNQSHPDVQFVIVGDGSFLEEAKRLSQKLANVTWIDRKPLAEMPYLFAKSDVMIVSLNADPAMSMVIPGKLQAYFAAGKPVLGFINGAAADIILEAEAGLVARAENVDELVCVIRKFVGMTKSDLDQLGRNASRFYDQSFVQAKVIQKIESELFQAVEKYRRIQNNYE